MPPLTRHPILFGKNAASSFAHFMAFKICEGYHVDMLSTNLAFLVWLAALVYAFTTPWTAADLTAKAGSLMVSAFCNFFAVATTRFNDSGFTSGLSMLLPPFFFFSFLVLLAGALPTMLVAGSLAGQLLASSQGLLVTLFLCGFLALAAVFFHDALAWLPQVGYLGGAGSSEGFESSYKRAGLLPAAFAGSFTISVTFTPLLSTASLPLWQTAGLQVVVTSAALCCLLRFGMGRHWLRILLPN
ncbi:ARK1 [Symbiodinium natans]|uniref:ARK1 protein n=1 Tax=Symbiodinium natans TaxID=878477 RepID=A0A812KCT9_9DINO|nr:ARK1 [Symbiodinium natans]